MEINASSPAASALTMKMNVRRVCDTPCDVPGLDRCRSHSRVRRWVGSVAGDVGQIESERGDFD